MQADSDSDSENYLATVEKLCSSVDLRWRIWSWQGLLLNTRLGRYIFSTTCASTDRVWVTKQPSRLSSSYLTSIVISCLARSDPLLSQGSSSTELWHGGVFQFGKSSDMQVNAHFNKIASSFAISYNFFFFFKKYILSSDIWSEELTKLSQLFKM